MTDSAMMGSEHQAGHIPAKVTATDNLDSRPGACCSFPEGSGVAERAERDPSYLGNNTKLDSAPILEKAEVARKILSARMVARARRWMEQVATGDPRLVRFAQLAFLREKLPGAPGQKPEFRTKACLSHLQFERDFLSLLYNGERNKARFYGAAVCGSVWTCPICSERITAVRRAELKKLLALTKYQVVMVTFTLEHQKGEELGPMVNALNAALKAAKTHRPWRKFVKKWGLVGCVYALEVTHGQNGWHPHRHEMFILDPAKTGLTGKAAKARFETEMRDDLYAIYRQELQRAGRDCDQEHGVKVSANRREYGDYISKWGVTEELTRSTNKLASNGGKSVWELLTASVNGDFRAWELFLEYARAFKGKKQLHWSAGLRDLLELPSQEMTDEEVAAVPQQAEEQLIAEFSRFGLYYLRDHDLYGPVIKFTELSGGNVQMVLDYLARMGLRRYVTAGAGSSGEHGL